jgi:solute carrier family 25 (mitochondrial phosphate transporter), member 23/24/25/41
MLSSSLRYSAIDMSTFEALKLTYVRSTGKEEPGVLALLAFGSVSGSVGACSVYPLNLVRTRLQASGSPAHPRRYTGIWDVVSFTYKQSGVRGFYIGKCVLLFGSLSLRAFSFTGRVLL